MDSGDFSDASRAGLMNLQSRDYDYDMLENLGLHADKFPTLRPSCAIAGRLTEEAPSVSAAAVAAARKMAVAATTMMLRETEPMAQGIFRR